MVGHTIYKNLHGQSIIFRQLRYAAHIALWGTSRPVLALLSDEQHKLEASLLVVNHHACSNFNNAVCAKGFLDLHQSSTQNQHATHPAYGCAQQEVASVLSCQSLPL